MKPLIRIGLIGLGQRGMVTLQRYQHIEGARIVALCDLSEQALTQGEKLLGNAGTALYQGESRWRSVCEREDIDLVYICTDWASHTRMAVYAMQQGKDVALEVPAAMSVEECWQLVETAEQTHRRCMMLENCCYDTFHLGIMGMLRKGLFGEVSHCEGAYIHDLRTDRGWVSYTVSDHGGNPYPTHGLGPICQILGINHGDRLVSLTSISGCNHVNNTLIQTERGKSILLQFDERTPRPYNRLQTLCGTTGFAQKYPRPTIQLDGHSPIFDTEAEQFAESHHDEATRRLVKEGKQIGVPNLMNYIMDRRLIDALRADRPLDMTVYDAALWSCITELSARSATQGGKPVDIPDFTRGRWQ
ncbi:MAG: Gfo/Idh/MocA family oxidoreductase [Bacteroidaceae bacterium]|nr:Gfo/Idh/MocA family oxidoreductase [Bacteroidaceae bacterium]